jgi:hypothetical protein
MVFWFFRRTENTEETEPIWNNDERPSYETTRARFRIHKQIRDGNVPVLKPVVKVIDDPLHIATYKKGSIKLYERQEINSPSGEVEEEVIVSDTELRPHKRRRRRKRRKRHNSEN